MTIQHSRISLQNRGRAGGRASLGLLLVLSCLSLLVFDGGRKVSQQDETFKEGHSFSKAGSSTTEKRRSLDSSPSLFDSVDLLSNPGSKSLPITTDTVNTIQQGGLTLAVNSLIKKSIRAEGDEAMQYVVDKMNLPYQCNDKSKNLIILDVGGLYGDFGLSTARRGCRTIIFEPQRYYSQLIARSAILNDLPNLVRVRHTAVSPMERLQMDRSSGGQTFFEEPSTSSSSSDALTMTDQLDRIVGPQEEVLLLKVDVEGFEGMVVKTARKLFARKKVRYAIFEYTPKQFEHRGTDWKSFLPELYNRLGAQTCFCLARQKPKVYRIPRGNGMEQQFFDAMKRTSMQTDVFCSFRENDPLLGDAPEYFVGLNLLK